MERSFKILCVLGVIAFAIYSRVICANTTPAADWIVPDTGNFNHNLNANDTTIQKIADKFDDYNPTESDPVYTNSNAAGITSTDKTNWGAAYTHSQTTSNNPHGVTAAMIGLGSSNTPRFGGLGLGRDADSKAMMYASGQYGSAEEVITPANSNGLWTANVNWSNGNVKVVRMVDGTNYFSFNNALAGMRYLLQLIQSANANGTASWPSTVRWQGGAAPTITLSAGRVDLVACSYCANTGNYFCGWSGNY